MTLKQRFLKIVYPFWILLTRMKKHNVKILVNDQQLKPSRSIYDLSVQLNNGKTLPLSEFRGKKMMLVNTASDCGYTNQYADLQKLYQHMKEDVIVIGFPANDYKEQEKGSDEEIASFCAMNFGVSFPLAKKSTVRRSEDQNPVFRWLTSKELNGWTSKQPSWNFSKYLISEEGILTHYFDPSIEPLSAEVISAINS